MIDPNPSHGRYTLRALHDADRDWMWPCQRDTFRPYVEPLFGWDEDEALFFFEKSWRQRQVVMVEDQPAGWLELAAEANWLFLKDIGLLPDYRNQGLGTRIIEDVFAHADAQGMTVELQVLVTNPAIRLYERLGFVPSHIKMYRQQMS